MNAPVGNRGDIAMVACHSELADESFRSRHPQATHAFVQNLSIP
jgi:hypothetical protein